MKMGHRVTGVLGDLLSSVPLPVPLPVLIPIEQHPFPVPSTIHPDLEPTQEGLTAPR